jgi:hypothetical protein
LYVTELTVAASPGSNPEITVAVIVGAVPPKMYEPPLGDTRTFTVAREIVTLCDHTDEA